MMKGFSFQLVWPMVACVLACLAVHDSADADSIVSWGRDAWGQVSDTPTGNNFTSIAGGGEHSLVMRSDGSIVSWGWDFYGQVSDTPTGNDFVGLATRGHHNLALKSDGSIVAWGSDSYGQVSDTPSGNGFIAIAGGNHNVALRSDGSIVSWGDDHNGQVTDTPTGHCFTAIAAGGSHSLALVPEPTAVSLLGFCGSTLILPRCRRAGRRSHPENQDP